MARAASSRVYINGEELAAFSDTSYAKGGLGFIASNVDAPANHIHFDNSKIWSTEAAAAGGQPSTLPTTGESPSIAAGALAGVCAATAGRGRCGCAKYRIENRELRIENETLYSAFSILNSAIPINQFLGRLDQPWHQMPLFGRQAAVAAPGHLEQRVGLVDRQPALVGRPPSSW